MLRSEKREKIKKNRSKMAVSGRSIFTIQRAKEKRVRKHIEK